MLTLAISAWNLRAKAYDIGRRAFEANARGCFQLVVDRYVVLAAASMLTKIFGLLER